ncbi:MAG TPA: valine--tRNA ligase, partial [Deltaproteobacteria bacterium]|nr:valine--tRNA ligase [Deltaproteobacteria bacterium]
MAVLGSIDLSASFDHLTLERDLAAAWDRLGLYRFDPDGEGEIFSVDTPPPYVSAAHLHVGHAMSYTQAEIVVRWHRMKGRRLFYPMGFDDNGLPTERYVEHTHKIDKASTTRAEFRALCLEETREGATSYTALWRSLGLSVDRSLGYSTIDDHCRATAQRSFLELLARGRIYRGHDPVLWDPSLQTALAQADLETKTRRQKLYTLRFSSPGGSPLPIATTRPELLLACVALYHHPDDPRYAGLERALEPLEQRRVPVLTDPGVDRDFGTGLMMVCTFGDGEDVRRWKRDGLPLRIRIGPDGRMTGDAGRWAGLSTPEARRRIVAELEVQGILEGFVMTEQAYPVAERSGAAVEWAMMPQWFLRVLDRKEALLKRSAELIWNPPWMRSRLDHWIEGLRWDWNLSRQRFYGVPFPVWLCTDCQRPVLARTEDLPVDPTEAPPPVAACPACGGSLQGDPDVMDTWMTSSMTPQINANWVGTEGRIAGPMPMDVRVQAFEIIRTWLFYTLVKADLHHDALPWRQVMISGWGLNEQGKKISKRDLMHSTDTSGFNRYDPAQVIARWGADALRHWAARTSLGQDSRYHTREVRAGRRVVVKLWNAARLAAMSLEDFDPDLPRARH